VAECGFIPGSLYTLSTFYKRSELATVSAVFFLGSNLASATSGLLAYGILPLGSRAPRYHGWQWLMIIEGSMAIFVAVLIICFLPSSPIRPRPLFFPIRYFTDREEQIVKRRVVSDDAAKAETSRRLRIREVLRTLGNWRVWPHVVMAISYISPTSAMSTYGPTIIRSFNFDGEFQAKTLADEQPLLRTPCRLSLGGYCSP
jgi:MFS family permease